MVKRAQRDPGAPKRNMSAYLLYQNAMREPFKALNPGKNRVTLWYAFVVDTVRSITSKQSQQSH